jgi:hypothetical protein
LLLVIHALERLLRDRRSHYGAASQRLSARREGRGESLMTVCHCACLPALTSFQDAQDAITPSLTALPAGLPRSPALALTVWHR